MEFKSNQMSFQKIEQTTDSVEKTRKNENIQRKIKLRRHSDFSFFQIEVIAKS